MRRSTSGLDPVQPAVPGRTTAGAATLIVGLAGAAAATLAAFPDRPPLAHTGGFGEPTCQRCHAGSALNSPGGTLTFEGFPAVYEPEQRYRLSVRLDSRGMRRGGFQLAIRFSGGEPPGEAAGGLRPLDERVQLDDSLGVGYAFQTSAGSVLIAPNQAQWRVEWTAPAAGGRVVAHIVANAANDDASELGDLVYADSAVSDPER